LTGKGGRETVRSFSPHLVLSLHRDPAIVSAQAHDSALLRDWKTSRVPVYFDFGESRPDDPFNVPTLWRLNPNAEAGGTYLSPMSKSHFVEVQLNGVPFYEPFTEAIGVRGRSSTETPAAPSATANGI
jgi:hypothetical protein